MTESSDYIVDVQNLTRSYQRKTALQDVNLQIPAGEVLGLVGENGAGKTTLIRHMLGLLKPQQGSVRVFGVDPVSNPERVLSRIGYVSEDRDLPEWMKVGEVLNFSRNFYPDWDNELQDELVKTFSLSLGARIKELSRGERARVCLVNALSHRPDLLLLDEPSSGLDPVVRRDVLGAIIQTIANEGRTVLFSSHLLDEVQRVADRVCMIDSGQVIVDQPLEQMFEEHRSITFRLPESKELAPSIEGALSVSGSSLEWTALVNNDAAAQRSIAELNGTVLNIRQPRLEEIFIARTENGPQVSAETRA